MHGNPGNSLDWLGVLRVVPPGARAIAFDMPGFGSRRQAVGQHLHARGGDRVASTARFRELGIDRVHLVGHDIGSVSAIEWASHHPRSLASATVIAGGAIVGYRHHYIAQQYRTPVQGENFQKITNRDGFFIEIQRNNPRPLPREFFDRDYDHFDRATRCAVLKAYRSVPENPDDFARPQADRLRPHDKPALVLWGDKRPVHIATGGGEPEARLPPCADPHLREHRPLAVRRRGRALRRADPVVPRRAGAGAVRRPDSRASHAAARRGRGGVPGSGCERSWAAAAQPLPGARISFAGVRTRTDASGIATVRARLGRPGRRAQARAAKATLRQGPLHGPRAALSVRSPR